MRGTLPTKLNSEITIIEVKEDFKFCGHSIFLFLFFWKKKNGSYSVSALRKFHLADKLLLDLANSDAFKEPAHPPPHQKKKTCPAIQRQSMKRSWRTMFIRNYTVIYFKRLVFLIN